MKVTIFTTRIKSSKLFDGEKSVSNPPATAKLNEYFRKSILLAALNQMGKDAERQKLLRDSIIESWLDKTYASADPNSVGKTREELKSLILDYYKELDNKGNDESIKNSLQKTIDSIHHSPFSFNEYFISFSNFFYNF